MAHGLLPSLVAQTVKTLPDRESQVQSLGLKKISEKGMGTHSLFLPENPMDNRILVGHSPWSCKELDD